MGKCTFCHLGSTGMCLPEIEELCIFKSAQTQRLDILRLHPKTAICTNCSLFYQGECSWSRGEGCQYPSLVPGSAQDVEAVAHIMRTHLRNSLIHYLDNVKDVTVYFNDDKKRAVTFYQEDGTYTLCGTHYSKNQISELKVALDELLKIVTYLKPINDMPCIRKHDIDGITYGLEFNGEKYVWKPLSEIPEEEEAVFRYGTISPQAPLRTLTLLGFECERISNISVHYEYRRDFTPFKRRMEVATRLVSVELSQERWMYPLVHVTEHDAWVKQTARHRAKECGV